MPSVNVRESEPVDVAIRRFKRACEKDNILADIRRHEFYEKPKWVRKRLKMAAIKRLAKKLMREKVGPGSRPQAAAPATRPERNDSSRY